MGCSVAYFSFGRHQPLTVGHAKHFAELSSAAQAVSADCYVFVSKSHNGKTDPVTPTLRKIWVQKIVGPKVSVDVEKDPFACITRLAATYQKLVYYTGADYFDDPVAKTMFDRMVKYGATLGVDVGYESSGDRTVGISGTKMREFAINEQYRNFIATAPVGYGNFDHQDAANMYDAVALGLRL